MTLTPKTRTQIVKLRDRLRKAEATAESARADLRAALGESRDEGASVIELAEALGVSRQRVYSFLSAPGQATQAASARAGSLRASKRRSRG